MTVEAWLSHLEAHGRRPNTILTYGKIVRGHFRRLTAAGLSVDPWSITDETIRWLAVNSQFTPSARQQAIMVLGAWVEWETGSNPVKKADILWNHVEPERHFIDSEILADALAVADPRERLVLLMGAKMGLRRMEIAGARLSDIEGNRILIWGKGHGTGKPAKVLMPEIVREALDDYLRLERDKLDPYRRIPEVILRTYHGVEPITPSDVGNIMTRIEKKCGHHITAHSLRRLFATTLHEDLGADIHDICTLMRHDSIETTRIYIRTNQARLDDLAERV